MWTALPYFLDASRTEKGIQNESTVFIKKWTGRYIKNGKYISTEFCKVNIKFMMYFLTVTIELYR